MSKVKAGRYPDGVAEWIESYAKERGWSETDLLVAAAESYKEDAERGVPELRERAKRQVELEHAKDAQDQGVGICPGRAPGLGHVWKSWKVDPQRGCKFCPKPGREFFAEATGQRTELFSRLSTPDSIKKPKGRAA